MQDNTKSLVALSLAHFVNDGSLYVFITLYPKLLPLSSDLILIGSLASLQNIFSVVASPIVGRTADAKKNYVRLLVTGLSLMAFGIIGFSVSGIFASGIWLFLLLIPFAVTAGVGSSFYHPLAASMLNEKWGSGLLGRALGINGAIGSTGRALFPVIVVALAVFYGIPSVGLLALIVFACIVIVVPILRNMTFGSKEQIPDSQSVPSRQSIPLRLLLPKILALTIVSFLKGFFTIGVVDFIPVYLKTDMGLRYGLELGAIFTLVLAMAIFGQPALGLVADKLGRRLTLGISTAGASLCIFLLISTSSLPLQVISLAVFGFIGLTGYPMLLPLASSIVPKEATATSNSIVWGFGTVGGGAVGPFVIGLLSGPAFFGSLNGPFFIAATVSIVAIPLLPLVPRPKR